MENHYEIICDRLFALNSWNIEQKSHLLEIIVDWTTKFEQSIPEQLNTHLYYLRELLTHNVLLVPLAPINTIFKVLQSTDIPPELWLDCLLAAVNSSSDTKNENRISFDFTPVTVSDIDTSSVILFNSNSFQHNNDNQSIVDDVNLPEQLLSIRRSFSIQQPISPSVEPLEEYQTLLLENLEELSQLKWDRSLIESLRRTFTKSEHFNSLYSLRAALHVVETIVLNRISFRLHIERIVNTITKKNANQWMNVLNKIVDEQGKNKPLQTLFHELGQENSFLNLVDLEQQYRSVMNYYENQTSIMTLSEIKNQHNSKDKFYKIALIIQAVCLFKQVRPRDIQILSLLISIEKQGRLAQIRTGEGKSIIIAMLTVYLCLTLESKTVDIITTSEILAQRDAIEYSSFYEIFDLTVGHNCCNSSEIANYRVNIVYGTVNQFAGDLLRTEFYLKHEVRGERPYSAVIVDEVDSMFIDQHQHSTQLASLTPGYKSLNSILKFIFLFFDKYELTDNNEFVIQQANGFVKVDALAFIREKLNDKKLIQFPEYRRSYIDLKLPKWVKNARRAYELHCNIDYIINKNHEIIPVDYMNTGVSQMNMHWSDGLHQFLQLKHHLRVTPERMCDSFYSNVTLFKKYQYLYGLTGTLGGHDAQQFIRTVYSIDVVIIPKYIDSEFRIEPSQFAINRNIWLEKIREECRTFALTKRRAVLIICQTIQDANDVQSYLRSQHSKIKLYLRSDEHTKPEDIHTGDVIVATNLAGRGTDLKVMTTVVDQGGLHVIVTFLPNNSRVEQQAFGRAGRQGQPGSARLIVYKEFETKNFLAAIDERKTIENLKHIRDQFEHETMNEAIEEVRRIEAKDRLLVRFLDLVHSRKVDLPFTEDVLKPGFDSLRELWGSFCDENSSTTIDQHFSTFADQIQHKLDVATEVMKQTRRQTSSDQIADVKVHVLRQLIVHPKYFIFAGIEMICMTNVTQKRRRALALFEQAIQLDSQDFVAYYNTVVCYIEDDRNSISKAIQAFNQAICLLENEIEQRKLVTIHHDPSAINRSSLAELIFLQRVLEIFQGSRDQLQNINIDNNKIICHCESWKNYLPDLSKTDYKEVQNEVYAEYEEWVGEGLMWIFIFEVEPKRCWWKTIFVCVMGIAQIVGGIFACAAGHWKLGTSMVLNGAFDVYLSVATKITADFDLVDFFKKKVITYGADLLCITPGISNLVTPIASIEQIRLVGAGVTSVHQLITKGVTIETLTDVASNAMNLAGIDNKTIDYVKQIPERYKDVKALMSGDFNQMIERGKSVAVDQFLGLLDKNSTFGGKTQAMFQIVHRHTPLVKHIYNGDTKAIVSYAMNNIEQVLPQIPVTEMFGIGLPQVMKNVINEEAFHVNNLYKTAMQQLNSIQGECSSQSFEFLQQIFKSPDKWQMFDKYKHEFNNKICDILRPAIEYERKFDSNCQRLKANPEVLLDCNQLFKSLDVKFGTIRNQRNDIQRAIERQQTDNPLIKQVMMTFVDELCQTSTSKRKSSEATDALKDYLTENIIRPSIENACEQEMDRQDQQLVHKFNQISKYIQEQHQTFTKL